MSLDVYRHLSIITDIHINIGICYGMYVVNHHNYIFLIVAQIIVDTVILMFKNMYIPIRKS